MLANGLMKGASTRIGMSMTSLPVTLAPHRLQLSRNVSAPAYEGLPPPAGRTFTQYSIYKGKAAVAFKAIAPTFRPNQNDFAVDREGVLLLEFAQVLPNQGNQSSYGARTYDWKNKVTFALKALELAQLTDLDNLPDPSKGVDLFHDPNKGNPDAANSPKVSKAFKFAYAPSGEGYMMSISQKIGAQNSFVSVPVTRAEFVVLKHLAAYLIPRMYGFDYLFEGQGAVPANLVEAEAVLQ